MKTRMRWLLLLMVFVIAGSSGARAQQPSPPANGADVLDGDFWKRQGLQQILPAWTEHAADPEARGAFFAELDRDWTPKNTDEEKYPGMVGRHLFSYASAYLMSGEEQHLTHAQEALDFMIEHGWDEKHGGFYNAVSRTGRRAIDPSKDLFMQIYAATGLALYYAATHSDRALRYLKRTNQLMEEHAWDTTRGGYVRSLHRDLSVKETYKDFSPQLAPLSGYLLYLYRVTRNEAYLRQAERIMAVVLENMREEEMGWILERFERSWQFLPSDRKNRWVNVGHNVEVAWVLLRLYLLTDKPHYRRLALRLNRQLVDHAFMGATGAWVHRLKVNRPSEHPEGTPWWVQAYGNFLQLYVYRVTGDETALRRFQKGARFWNEHFMDRRFGGTVLMTSLDGEVMRGAKAVRTKTSYHAMEHSLLGYLLVSLWTEDDTATLHFHVDNPAPGEKLYPALIEGQDIIVRRAEVNGKVRSYEQDGGVLLREGGEPARVKVVLEGSAAPAPEDARFDLVVYGRGFATGEHRVLLKTNPGMGEQWESVGALTFKAAPPGDEWRAVIVATDLSGKRYLGQDFRENAFALKIVPKGGAGAQLGAVYAVPHRSEHTEERLTRAIEKRPLAVRRRSLASYVRPRPAQLQEGIPFIENVEAPVRFQKPGVAEVEWLEMLFGSDDDE